MRLIERRYDAKMHSAHGYLPVPSMLEVAFDSPEEVLGVAREYSAYDSHWAGATFAEVRRWCSDGAPKLMENMLRKVDAIELPDDYMRPELLKRRRRTRGDSGNELDIHQVYQGRMDRAWDRTEVEHVKTVGNRLVHVIINLSASAFVAHDAGLWRGACALRIYDALVKMGKSVAISVYQSSMKCWTNPGYPRDGMLSVRIKNYGEPIREDRLAAFSSMEFLRTAVFGSMSHCGVGVAYGHGSPISNPKLVTASAVEDLEHGGATVVIEQAFSRDMAQQTIDKFIEMYVSADAKPEGFTAEERERAAGYHRHG